MSTHAKPNYSLNERGYKRIPVPRTESERVMTKLVLAQNTESRDGYTRHPERIRVIHDNSSDPDLPWTIDAVKYTDFGYVLGYTYEMDRFKTYDDAMRSIPEFIHLLKHSGVDISRLPRTEHAAA